MARGKMTFFKKSRGGLEKRSQGGLEKKKEAGGEKVAAANLRRVYETAETIIGS